MSKLDDFAQELVTHRRMLRNFALKLTSSEDRAADLVQETMLKALVHQGKFQLGTNMAAWLCTILRNQHHSEFRKRRREVEDADGAIAGAVPFEDSPLRKMEANEAIRFIDKMPDTFRVPLRLIADGASYEEVAIELCEQVGTIKSRVNRGRAILKMGT